MKEVKTANIQKRLNSGTETEVESEGKFYHIEILPPQEFKRFRAQNVEKQIGIECVGGQYADGSWETIKWLVGKELAHIENGRLVADHADVQQLFDDLNSAPKHIEGNCFQAKPRRKITEKY